MTAKFEAMQAYCSEFKKELPLVYSKINEFDDLFLRAWLPNNIATQDSPCKVLEGNITDFSPNFPLIDYKLLRKKL